MRLAGLYGSRSNHPDVTCFRLLCKKLLGLTICQPGVVGKTALLSDKPQPGNALATVLVAGEGVTR